MPERGLSAAEHLEAALEMLGYQHGSWKIELDVAGGLIRRFVADPRGVRVALNREELERPPEMGESAA